MHPTESQSTTRNPSSSSTQTEEGDLVISRTRLEGIRTACRRLLATCVWLVSLGLVAVAIALVGGGALGWLLFGSEALFAFTLFAGAILGAVGSVLLVHNLESAVGRLLGR